MGGSKNIDVAAMMERITQLEEALKRAYADIADLAKKMGYIEGMVSGMLAPHLLKQNEFLDLVRSEMRERVRTGETSPSKIVAALWGDAPINIPQLADARDRLLGFSGLIKGYSGIAAKLARDPKHAAKAEAFKLWQERRAGKHPGLRTNEQFAMECMRRWPVLTSAKVILGWCTAWNKEAKRQKSQPAS